MLWNCVQLGRRTLDLYWLRITTANSVINPRIIMRLLIENNDYFESKNSDAYQCRSTSLHMLVSLCTCVLKTSADVPYSIRARGGAQGFVVANGSQNFPVVGRGPTGYGLFCGGSKTARYGVKYCTVRHSTVWAAIDFVLSCIEIGRIFRELWPVIRKKIAIVAWHVVIQGRNS